MFIDMSCIINISIFHQLLVVIIINKSMLQVKKLRKILMIVIIVHVHQFLVIALFPCLHTLIDDVMLVPIPNHTSKQLFMACSSQFNNMIKNQNKQSLCMKSASNNNCTAYLHFDMPFA